MASVISSESAISVYERPTTSRRSSAIFRSTFSALDGAPHRVDRLEPLHRSVDDLERRNVLQRDNGTRSALGRTQLVEHAVLRHLEEPGRELRAEREPRQALEDPEEDLLRQILGQRAIADKPQHIVEDRNLIGTDDERERPLVAFLCLPQDAKIRLLK